MLPHRYRLNKERTAHLSECQKTRQAEQGKHGCLRWPVIDQRNLLKHKAELEAFASQRKLELQAEAAQAKNCALPVVAKVEEKQESEDQDSADKMSDGEATDDDDLLDGARAKRVSDLGCIW